MGEGVARKRSSDEKAKKEPATIVNGPIRLTPPRSRK
jgi:hypothetical protein